MIENTDCLLTCADFSSWTHIYTLHKRYCFQPVRHSDNISRFCWITYVAFVRFWPHLHHTLTITAQPQSDALLYQRLVICSCDTENSVYENTLILIQRSAMVCFQRTNSIKHHWHNRFFTSEHTMVKNARKYCYAVSFEKELFLKIIPYTFPSKYI